MRRTVRPVCRTTARHVYSSSVGHFTIPRVYYTQETRSQKIRNKLTTALKPTELEIEDSSDGCAGGNITIVIKSKSFEGQSMLAQHRSVQSLIKEELKDVHSIRIDSSPS